MSSRNWRLTAAALVLGPALTASAVLYASSDSDGSDRARPVRELTRQEKSLLHQAEERLLRDCMHERGFRYRMSAENPLPEARNFPYVIDDVAWAGEHGYGSDIQRKLTEVRTSDPNQRYFKHLSPQRKAAALKAANGASPRGLTARTPDGMVLTRSDEGCRADTERTLYGDDLKAWFQARSTTEALPEMARQRVLKDPRFTRAVRPWAHCMRNAGHSYASPAELRTRVGSLPREQEVRLAIAEAKCARSSGFAETAKALDRKYNREFRQQHRTEVDNARRLQLAAIPRARSVTEEQGTEK